jgi:hypothetical protein
LNVQGFNNVGQTEIRTEEPLVLEPRSFELEMAIENLKTHISQGNLVAENVGERRLRMFENTVLRVAFGPKRDEVTREWRKLCNEEHNDLYCSTDIIPVI